jgi:hypothetical protein
MKMTEPQPSFDFTDLPACMSQEGGCNMIGQCILAQTLYEQACTGGEVSPGVLGGPNWKRQKWGRLTRDTVSTATDPQEPCLFPSDVTGLADRLTAEKQQRGELK